MSIIDILLHVGTTFLDLELDQMEDYIKVANQALAENLGRTRARIESMVEGMTEEEADNFADYFSEEYFAQAGFSTLLFSSFIVIWYAFVVQKLLELSSDLKLESEIEPEGRKENKKEIDRIRNSLVFNEYKFHEQHDQTWQEFIKIKRLRDIIVHQGTHIQGSLTKPTKYPFEVKIDEPIIDITQFYISMESNLYKYLEEHNMLSIAGTNVDIAPTYEYCMCLIGFARKLFATLFKDLRNLNIE